MLELTFLGSGNAFTPGGRYWSSFLANGRYLFDIPPTVLPHLKRLGQPAVNISVVFITHFHGDHFAGLPFLLLEYAYLSPRRDDLHIIGPPGLGPFLEDFVERCYPGLSEQEAAYRRVHIEADPTRSQNLGDLPFQAVRMQHTSGRLDCFGYRVAVGGKILAYTGDTEYCPQVPALAEDSDVLVVDATYSRGSGPDHMGLDDIRRLRKEIAPSTTIILTHLHEDPDLTGLDNVIVAQDFATYHFP